MKRLSNVEDLSVGSFESGAQMLNLELHCHTAFSKDGLMGFDSLIRTAHMIGLDALAITDHDTIEGASEFQQRAQSKGLTLQIITGEEKTLSDGSHLIGRFLRQHIESGEL